jgi:16S rRNA (guanine966-N2)-methyltransferase
LFSILADRLDNANVLDLFAGTGALGFEALSRGAAHATFVEQHRPTAGALRGTATDLGVTDRSTIIPLSAERAAKIVEGRYDLVFADPPYAQAYPAAAFAALRERGAIDERSLVVYEHSSRDAAPADPGFSVQRTAIYGEVALAFLAPEPAA